MLFEDCRLFSKQKKDILVFIAFVLLTSGLFVRTITVRNSGLGELHYRNWFFVVDTFLYSLDLGKILFIFFLLFSVFSYSKNCKDGVCEIIMMYDKPFGIAAASKTLLLTLLNLSVSVLWFLIEIFYVILVKKSFVPEYLAYMCKAWIAFIIMPNMLAIIFGFVLSKIRDKKIRILSIMMVTYLFCGNFVSLMHGLSWKTAIPYEIGNLFSIFVRGTQKAHDLYYIVSAEPGLILKDLMWFFIAMTVYSFLFVRERRKKVFFMIYPLIATGVICFLLIGGFSSVNSDNESGSTFDVWSAPQYYYRNHNSIDVPAVFSVCEYNIDIGIGFGTSFSVVIIPDIKDLPKYYFTLYHDYSVKAVKSLNGESLGFKREGDYLIVDNHLGSIDGMIIEYRGNSSLYYSTKQGINLPAFFPYYPIAGCYTVFDGQDYYFKLPPVNELSKDNETYFKVSVRGLDNIFCSLPREEKNLFAGYATSVSILGSEFARQIDYKGYYLVYSALEISDKDALNALIKYSGSKEESDPNGIFLLPYTMYRMQYKNRDILMTSYDRFISGQYEPDEEQYSIKRDEER
ncbi:MAG: hypothetical protein IKP92_09395 [Lachnospiraceae bacterium]|nr:hypothetical protein [Lachnospiraceae bacterium]